MFPSYRKQSIDLQSKLVDSFLYDGNVKVWSTGKKSDENLTETHLVLNIPESDFPMNQQYHRQFY